MQDNLEQYLHGKFTAGERRVLITKWVGEAWEELSEDKDIAVRAFKKCGISTAADGSEDFEIHLEGLENYEIRMEDEEEGGCDPFADLSDDGSIGSDTEGVDAGT